MSVRAATEARYRYTTAAKTLKQAKKWQQCMVEEFDKNVEGTSPRAYQADAHLLDPLVQLNEGLFEVQHGCRGRCMLNWSKVSLNFSKPIFTRAGIGCAPSSIARSPAHKPLALRWPRPSESPSETSAGRRTKFPGHVNVPIQWLLKVWN
jgi:hypothetical protein